MLFGVIVHVLAGQLVVFKHAAAGRAHPRIHRVTGGLNVAVVQTDERREVGIRFGEVPEIDTARRACPGVSALQMLTSLHKALLIPSLGVNHPNLLVPRGLVDVPHPVAQRQALGRIGNNARDASSGLHARIGSGRPNLFQRPTAIGTDKGGHDVLLCGLRLGLSGRRVPGLCLVGDVGGLELVHEGGAGVAPNIERNPRQRFDSRRLGRIGRSRLGRLDILVSCVSCGVLGDLLLGGGQLLGRLCRRGQVAVLNKRAVKLGGKCRSANGRELRHAERAQVERGSIGRRRALLSRVRRDNASRAPLDDPHVALACNDAKVVGLQHRRVRVAIRELATAQSL